MSLLEKHIYNIYFSKICGEILRTNKLFIPSLEQDFNKTHSHCWVLVTKILCKALDLEVTLPSKNLLRCMARTCGTFICHLI